MPRESCGSIPALLDGRGLPGESAASSGNRRTGGVSRLEDRLRRSTSNSPANTTGSTRTSVVVVGGGGGGRSWSARRRRAPKMERQPRSSTLEHGGRAGLFEASALLRKYRPATQDDARTPRLRWPGRGIRAQRILSAILREAKRSAVRVGVESIEVVRTNAQVVRPEPFSSSWDGIDDANVRGRWWWWRWSVVIRFAVRPATTCSVQYSVPLRDSVATRRSSNPQRPPPPRTQNRLFRSM